MADQDPLFEALLGHIKHHTDHLDSIHQDIHVLAEFFTAPNEVNMVGIDSGHPLNIDKRGRAHLYIMSPVALELFFLDVAGSSVTNTLAPFTLAAGKFQELPFRTGDRLSCPSLATNAGVIVYLLAQNQVLAL